MKKNRKPQRRQIYWGIKLHLETAVVDESQHPINEDDDRIFLRVEGKRRPMLILKDCVRGRYGKDIFTVAFVTTKNFDPRGHERNDLVPFSFRKGTMSFAEEPTCITENLIEDYETELHEQNFREIKQKLSSLRAQSWLQGDRSIQES